MRVVVRSIGNVVREAFHPVQVFSDRFSALLTGGTLIGGPLAVGRVTDSAPVGTVVGFGLLAALLLVALVKREYARQNIDLTFTADQHPEWLNAEQAFKVAVKVTSHTPKKKFTARCVGAVWGLLPQTPAGDFDFSWEGVGGAERDLRKDYPEFVPIALVEAGSRTVRFLIHAPVYSGGTGQVMSPTKTIVAEKVVLVLEVQEVEHEGFARIPVTIHLDENNGTPTVSVDEAMPDPVERQPIGNNAHRFIARIVREQESQS